MLYGKIQTLAPPRESDTLIKNVCFLKINRDTSDYSDNRNIQLHTSLKNLIFKMKFAWRFSQDS